MNVIIEFKPLSIKELKEAFFSLKINKSSGVDDVSLNIIKNALECFANPSSTYFSYLLKIEYFQMI